MIRFGVIGAGNIASAFCEAANGVGATLYAVASRNLDKAVDFQEKYGFKKAYGDYIALFEDPSVDCVYVATPHGLHYEHMMLALDYNKHILCEKAFTLNKKQAQAVLEKAKKNGCFVMEALWTRFLPTIKAVKSMVEEGIIGDIVNVEATFNFTPPKNDESRLFAPHLGGGALLDIGIYPLTLANLFLGTPSDMKSDVTYHTTGVDLASEVTLTYPNASAHLSFSFDKERLIEGFIRGTKGMIHIPVFNGADHAFHYDHQGQLIQEIRHPHRVNGLEYEILEVMDCLKNNLLESPIMPHSETLNILGQMDQLRASWNLVYPQEK